MAAKKKPTYNCAICGRVLKDGNWIYSTSSGSRYCTEKQGHKRPSKKRQQQIKDSWPSLSANSVVLLERYTRAA